MIEVGRVCVKTAGRDAGGYCVIIKVLDENTVEITGPKDVSGVRRKKCNIKHLELTEKKVNIKEGATDEEVKAAIEKEGLLDLFKNGVKIELW